MRYYGKICKNREVYLSIESSASDYSGSYMFRYDGHKYMDYKRKIRGDALDTRKIQQFTPFRFFEVSSSGEELFKEQETELDSFHFDVNVSRLLVKFSIDDRPEHYQFTLVHAEKPDQLIGGAVFKNEEKIGDTVPSDIINLLQEHTPWVLVD